MNTVKTIDSNEAFESATVGDFLTASFVETITDKQFQALENAGMTIAETSDGLLVLVDF